MRKTFGADSGLKLPVGMPLVAAGDRIFTSGLVADHPAGLESETHRVFQQAAALLREAGASLADVVRTRVFYVDEGPAGGSDSPALRPFDPAQGGQAQGERSSPSAPRQAQGERSSPSVIRPGSGRAETIVRDAHGVVFDHPGPAFTAGRQTALH